MSLWLAYASVYALVYACASVVLSRLLVQRLDRLTESQDC